MGGEWGGAALLAVESAPKKRKAFYSSGVQIGFGVGLLLATGSVSLVSHFTSNEDFINWGWRLPFLFSLVLVAIAWWIRNGMDESQEFEANKTLHERAEKIRKFPIFEALRQNPKAFLLIIALRFGELLTMYIVTAFAMNYSTTHLGLSRDLFLNIGLLVGAVSCVSIPCFAYLADSFGRRRIYVTGALIGVASTVPFFMALESRNTVMIIFFAIMLGNMAHDMLVSVQQPMFTELFGTAYRYSGAGVGYQVASVVGGGFTPFIAVLLVELMDGSWHLVAAYLALGCLLSAIVGMRMKPQTAE